MPIKQIIHFILHVTLLSIGIVALGGILGAILFAVLGPLFTSDYQLVPYLISGAKNGAQYAGVWAIGLAIVIATMKAYRKNHPEAE